jgi:hypothetical protein
MDEQECILEIVDGVLTIVPKVKSSTSSSIGEQENNNYNKIFQIDSAKNPKQRSSSIASSTSTPSLSEQEQERDEFSSISSSKPFALVHDKPLSPPPPPPPPLQTEQSADVLDLFSTPIISITPTNKIQKTLLDDSLSSVSSYGEHPIETKKQQTSILRSSSPINHKPKSSSIKGKRTKTHFTSICEQITYTLFGPLHV